MISTLPKAGPEASPKVYMFICSSETYITCIEKIVFGSDQPWPLQIVAGDYCLLHHYEAGAVFGLWKAVSNGGRNLVPKAWGKKFPYQVKVSLASQKVIEVPRDLMAEFKVDAGIGRFDSVVESQLAARVIQSMQGK